MSLPAAKPRCKVARFSEGRTELPWTDVFASGSHRDKLYSPSDIDDMVRNFNAHQVGENAATRVPAVIGHEEDQQFLERSDLPAAAWGAKARAVNDRDATGKPRRVLQMQFSDVPDEVADLIDGKRYRKVSAEVYDEPPDGMPGKGKVLRRVAFLGADPPQVKGLKDIPRPKRMSEQFASARLTVFKFSEAIQSPQGYWTCFAEVSPMGHEDLIHRLQSLGCDTARLEGIPDPGLEEMIRVIDSQVPQEEVQQPPAEQQPQAPPQPGETMPLDSNVTAETPPQEDQSQQQMDDLFPPKQADPAEQNAKMAERCGKFAARFKRMAEVCRQKFAEYADKEMGDEDETKFAEDDGKGDSDEDKEFGQKFFESYGSLPGDQNKALWAKVDAGGGQRINTDRDPSGHYKKGSVKWGEQFSEQRLEAMIERVLSKKTDNSIARFEKFTEEKLANEKKLAVESFCETRRKQGKILPRELDRSDPSNLFDELLRADAKTVISKFREGGKQVEATELDLKMRAIDKRPSLFTEKLADPKTKAEVTDSETEKIKQSFEKFSEQFPKSTKVEDLVEGFKAQKKYEPTLTAVEYLGPLLSA